ncbi:MAG TPA: hypothetical protein VK694_06490 [Verrucomicrobiae bacterium]|nr:hypothetical protein [Verrucomicrobiae bacterium]
MTTANDSDHATSWLSSIDAMTKAVFLTYVGGLLAILLAVLGDHNAGGLWAFILVAWGAMRVREGSAMLPLVHGAHYAAGYLLIGLICALAHDIEGLWAMILVNCFVNYHAHLRSTRCSCDR